MVDETRSARGIGDVRSDWSGGRSATGRPVDRINVRRGFFARIPTLKQLADLLVDGELVLPPGYRRGMFLDVLA
jgi:hypothetical protein